MVKTMGLTERMAMEWLLKQGYDKKDIVFNKKTSSPDFLLPDRKIEVKRPVNGTVFFTHGQLEGLEDDVEVFIMDEKKRAPVAIVPFGTIKKALPYGFFEHGNKRFRVSLLTQTEKLVIRCSTETKKAFRIFIANNDYKSEEEALRALLRQAGFLKEVRGF